MNRRLPTSGPSGDLFDAADALLQVTATPYTPSVILEVLQPPVTFHRVFVDITQSILAALMLSHAVMLSETRANANGWFQCSPDEWQAETGLNRFEQQTARRTLTRLGLLLEMKHSQPSATTYRVDATRLWERIAEHTAQRGRHR